MTTTEKDRITNAIKSESNRLGFISCGISKAEFLEEEAERLENWLRRYAWKDVIYGKKF
ncbi:MAG: hypothetical protein CM15mP129_01950 [Chloroflexota bacterium]|nr:MAG: hypothetical protein CM15mP129_01950 [Chloroflexota bacterium]